MLTNALLFTAKILLDFLTALFLLRFFFQLLHVSFQNQVGQMLVKLSNFAVKPLRKIIPSFKKIDLSTGLLAYFCQLLLGLLMLFFGQYRPFIFDYLFFLNLFAIAALGVTIISVTIFLYAVLIQAILSWINPYTPISAILDALSQPVLSVTRRLVPAVGGVDLTALVFLMMAQVLLLTILNPLQSALLTS